MQESVGLWYENGAAKQTSGLLCHGYEQVAFIEYVVAWNFACVVFLLLTPITIAASFIEVARCEQYKVTFVAENAPSKA